MSESEPQTTGESIANIRRVLLNAAPPKAAHHLTWTRVGEQILLEIGYFDLFAVQQQMDKESPPEKFVVDWLVTDRYILDFESGERFVRAMTALGQHLDKLRVAIGTADGNT